MGNTWACIRRSEAVSCFGKGGHDERAPPGVGGERGSSSDNVLERCDGRESLERVTRSGKVRSDVEERIERSKVHWSELTERESDVEDEEVAQENRQVFEELQSHPTWGRFFKTYGYDTKHWLRDGELVVGKKFAEGGQAELFHATLILRESILNDLNLKFGHEWVVKVFRNGTRLQQLREQWPLGFLQVWAEELDLAEHGQLPPTRIRCDVYCGTLLEDGRFAFIMKKEKEDLWNYIDCVMGDIGHDHGPFPKEESEIIMFQVAQGMNWMHSHNILHRDLKASNVLVHVGKGTYPTFYVADFECSIGVVGTGFFMSPEILQAIKNKVATKDRSVYTKEADAYSYGMLSYEVLTGKLPLQGHPRNDYDIILCGQRPRIPDYVDCWKKELVNRCWDVDRSKRPLFPEIVGILSSNSSVVRELLLCYQNYEEDGKHRKYQEVHKIVAESGYYN